MLACLRAHRPPFRALQNPFPFQSARYPMVKTRRASALASSTEDEQFERPTKKVKLEKTAVVEAAIVEIGVVEEKETKKAPKRLRKPKATTNIDPSTFLERIASPWKVGAHVSAAGGVENAVTNAAAIGANAFALFVKSQRKWNAPPLKQENIDAFKARMKEYGYTGDVVLPHGNYLVNLGNPDAEKREKSYDCFLDELKRCEQLGLKLFNFHPGSTVGGTTTAHSLSLIADCINRAHKETHFVITVLENMAGAGNVIGGEFSHLADIIAQVEDKSRVGVCMDTCHTFAAGYDIRTKETWDGTMSEFDSIIGLKYLRGMHLNDSKAELGTRKDRHENVGLGCLGLSAFQHILNDERTQGIPMILETPSFERPVDVWGKEIEILQRISRTQERLKLQVKDGVAPLVEVVQEVRAAVKAAEAASGKEKKGTKPKAAIKKVQKGKERVMVNEDENIDEDNGMSAPSAGTSKKTRKPPTAKKAPVKKKKMESEDESDLTEYDEEDA
ncbi:xylose isomerase-like protein [Crucibulum laeve]|uniref:Apurinic-apyrimidinic endonuclease 1 n=1 Tax=Crucibulum laeve TaxID=68775 RepID=A0A5C3LL89_9AGAR|nr:xylose isomerase-like protein [Crucibulum laeve]